MHTNGITAIIPAAGLSTRFPGNKLSYIVRGKPLIVNTVESIAQSDLIDPIIIVLGNDAPRLFDIILRFLNPKYMDRIMMLYNPGYSKGGMSDSIKIALKKTPETHHIMVHPADVALVSPSSIKFVVGEFIKSDKKVAVACYNSIPGHPIFFKNTLLDKLFTMSEETQGLKGILRPLYENNEVECIEVNDAYVLLDVDTFGDLHLSPDEVFKRKQERYRKRKKAGL